MASLPTAHPTYPSEWEVESTEIDGGFRLPSMEEVAISYVASLQGLAPESEAFVPESESFVPESESFVPESESFVLSTESMVPETESFIDSTPAPGSVEPWSPPTLAPPLAPPTPGSVEEATYYNFAQFSAEKYTKYVGISESIGDDSEYQAWLAAGGLVSDIEPPAHSRPPPADESSRRRRRLQTLRIYLPSLVDSMID
ncbi:uncharacterized protein LOC131004632 [Salvia miltiorrhiza]|uniref:uncharacterized protein LOC131004632 n=1 Tax=Salvia miltiorrhiza TaxID=226208 RepID=UPI0025ABEF35|nr:uncharacterized protein LOC131004632 [Salvia miltiorrhiza]